MMIESCVVKNIKGRTMQLVYIYKRINGVVTILKTLKLWLNEPVLEED